MAAADTLARRWLAAGDGALATGGADALMMVWRECGRFAAAAAVTRDARARRLPGLEDGLPLVHGSTLARLGDSAGAVREYTRAAAFDGRVGRADAASGDFPYGSARNSAWTHALLADALVVAGTRDTLRLAALADSIEVIGARSYYGRDWRLHRHVRGLLAARAGRWADAERQVAAARWGTAGWTRTTVELARAQLALARPGDAVRTLRDAYATPLDGMGRYVPRSELDAWMARAFAAGGRPDSAARYAARARGAWVGEGPGARAR